MPRIYVRRGDVPATALLIGDAAVQQTHVTARAAVICHPRGILMILQVPEEDDYRLVGYRGTLLPKQTADSILEEIAQHDIPDDHWVVVRRSKASLTCP